MVDIIESNSSHKKKLLLTNTKNERNGELYGETVKELKARISARCETSISLLISGKEVQKMCVLM